MANILIAPCFGSGHLLPHVALARRLVEAGHEVLLHVDARAAGLARKAGARPIVAPWGTAEADFMNARRDGDLIRGLSALAERVAPHLLRVLHRNKCDAVVTDALHLGAALAAERSGLPWATLATTPAVLSKARVKWGQARLRVKGLRRDLGLPPSAFDTVSMAISPRLLLLPWISTFDVGPVPKQAVHVGPLCWEEPKATLAPRWMQDLDPGRPFVLFGVSTAPFRVMEPLVNHYVSEAIRAANGLAINAVFTLGKGSYQIQEAPEPHVRLEEYVSHSLLMPQLDATVTHGGWGTIGHSVSCGKPVVVVPIGLDQPLNARLAEDVGVGLSISVHELTARKLAQRIERVLAPRSSYRQAADRLAMRIARTRSSRAVAVAIERLLRPARAGRAPGLETDAY